MTRRFLRLLPLLWLALWLLTSCGKEDDYYYPSVRLEFLTAHTGARGQLAEVRTDGGLLLPVAEDASGSLSRPDSTLRIVANYELLGDDPAAPTGVKLWAVGSVGVARARAFGGLPRRRDYRPRASSQPLAGT